MIKRSQYLAGKVRRWHTHHTLSQTLADHSHGVALIIVMLHPNPSANLLKEALLHDLPEYKTGDLPSTVKHDYPGLSNVIEHIENQERQKMGLPFIDLTEEEMDWLKFADSFEALLFIRNCGGAFAEEKMNLPALGRKAAEYALKLGINLDLETIEATR